MPQPHVASPLSGCPCPHLTKPQAQRRKSRTRKRLRLVVPTPLPMLALLAPLLALHWPSLAAAVPGPDSVAVVANANQAESVALAERYVAARGVPPSRLCALDLPEGPEMDLPAYQEQLLEPLVTCLQQTEALEAVEALLLVRGVPLRLRVPVGEEAQWASVAAALGVWRAELDDGTPVLGQPPGSEAMCGGSPCTAARWANPRSCPPLPRHLG